MRNYGTSKYNLKVNGPRGDEETTGKPSSSNNNNNNKKKLHDSEHLLILLLAFISAPFLSAKDATSVLRQFLSILAHSSTEWM